jgi:hypothetical protein
MNQDTQDIIEKLQEYKQAIHTWNEASDAEATRLRSYINQNSAVVRKIVAEAGCYKTLTISPPPAVGGMIMRNVDPFDMMFDPPYFMNMVSIVSDIIDRAIGVFRTNPPHPKKLESTDTVIKDHFVDPTRIRELEAISSRKYDTTKLVRLCEELNVVNNYDCYMTIAMLTRAIIDHVPPLLGVNTFTEVANNYKGTKSFKESMKHLQDSMRKISDSVLHTTIRKKETLPTFVQVNFSADLDVLLGEIVRVNKK